MLRDPRTVPALLVLVLTAATPAASQAPPGVRTIDDSPHRAAETITEADVLTRIGVLAHDSMRGRDTPSPELEQVAEWIAAEFRDLGLRPGAGDSFLQRYGIESVRSDAAASLLEVEGSGRALSFGGDFVPAFGTIPDGERRGGVVLVLGRGDAAPDLDAVDLTGRHVVLPAGGGPDFQSLLSSVYAAGPHSVLLLADLGDAEWEQRRDRADRVRTRLAGPPDEEPVVLLVRSTALLPLLRERSVDLARMDAPAAVEVVGLTLTLRGRSEVVEAASAPNVVGILPGSDPRLRDEYLVFSAHMDHVGVGRPDASGDSIYNGADDDASGTAAVMEIAEAFASLPEAPRRSLVFLLVSGEEKGLWGSAHFAASPTVPMDGIVANLNMDMVGRNWSDTIVAIGKEHSELGPILEEVNARHPELRMAAIDDRWPEERFYFRSDHVNFARRGVPILFFFNGTHPDYHRPSDEVERIDGEKTARIARLMFYVGLEVANRPDRPAWDPESRARIVEPGS